MGSDAKGEAAARAQRWRKALIGLLLLCCLCLSGVLFGFAALKLLLTEDGVFSDACDDGEDDCGSRSTRFAAVYTAGSTVAVAGGLFAGVLVDGAGPAFMSAVAGALGVAGALAFGMSEANGSFADGQVLVLGSVLLGAAGATTVMISLPSAFLWGDKASTVMAAINVCFDASSALPLLFYRVYLAGVGRGQLFSGYAVFLGLCYAAASLLWRLCEPQLQVLKADSAARGAAGGTGGEEDAALSVDKAGGGDGAAARGAPLSAAPLSEQLRSWDFAFATCFAVVHLVRSNLYLGTAEQHLTNLGDGEEDNLYAQIFQLSLPLSCVALPAVSFALERYDFTVAFHTVNALGALHGALTLVPVLEAQPAAFLVYTFYRAFLYSVLSAFNGATFGPRTIGRIHGSLFLICGCFNVLILPAVHLSNNHAGGRLEPLYGAALSLCAPCAAAVHLYDRFARRRSAAVPGDAAATP